MVTRTLESFVRRMSTTGGRSLIAVCQMTSTHDVDANFHSAHAMLKRAAERNAKMAFFPECFDFVGRNKDENKSYAVSENEGIVGRLRNAAKELRMWISLGGFHQKDPEGTRMPFITQLIIDSDGKTRGLYQKLHLFDIDIPGKVRLMESEFSTAGNKLARPVETPIGNVAMNICYDLRFPEVALWNRNAGAHILTYPSAFTVNTGLAHWEALLRARAIETQCYVVAAAQTGRNNEKRLSYGHSMVIDPWGAIVAQCSETVDMCFCEISLDYLNEVRKTQPVFVHRRSDLYSLIANEKLQIENGETYYFGEFEISPRVVFYRSSHSFAFVNRNPVLPGHVLVSPLRKAYRLTELSDVETADLFVVSKKIQAMLEAQYQTASSSVCVQDGPEAGQTVPHVHVHILPRKKGDFGGNADEVYRELAEHDKPGSGRKVREVDDMNKEALLYRNLLGTA